MLAGLKLLVADDSPYYRTVLTLTFADEGMLVTTASDKREALAQLDQSAPDVILANVSMPGISGYELCELIKQSERFSRIPVMLLVGAHEAFDQAEARRVGADDVVTKPFKSIRQLVNRVGSLLGGKSAEAESAAQAYSTLGLGRADEIAPAAPDNQIMTDTAIPVYVEAASMTDHEPIESAVETAGSTCVADVEMQTADTQQLERIDDEPVRYAESDTLEMKPDVKTEEEGSPADPGTDEQILSTGAPAMNEQPNTRPVQTQRVFNDGLLDLGDFDVPAPRAVAEDLILDLDYEEPPSDAAFSTAERVRDQEGDLEVASLAETSVAESEVGQPGAIELQEWAIIAPAPADTAPPIGLEDEGAGNTELSLSPETIEAIARRVVDQMSEKVVREIAWEVVPELAELLIKQKLDEQK